MKLRNKKTGEIDDYIFEVITDRIDLYRRVGHSDTKNIYHYNSLAELNADWEDYEETKEFWYIYADKPQRAECGHILEEDFKAIGNYFETKEEAEKAVERLRAWKRLKDKGFEIDNYLANEKGMELFCHYYGAVKSDLDLLFGGE